MTIKTITITAEAYEKIKRLKHENESFSQLFTRIADEKEIDISKFVGILKATPDEIERRRKKIKEIREEMGRDLDKRIKRLKRG